MPRPEASKLQMWTGWTPDCGFKELESRAGGMDISDKTSNPPNERRGWKSKNSVKGVKVGRV